MIFESTPVMTLLDMAFIAVAALAIAALWRIQQQAQRSLLVGQKVATAGLVLVALFYMADLLVMLAFPLLGDPLRSMELMRDLHLNLS